jgi:hypothetical protein
VTTLAELALREAHELSRRQSQLEVRKLDVQRGSPSDPLDLVDVRQRFDDTYRQLGAGSAPSPLPSESPYSYRRRLASELQHMSPVWRDADLFVLDPSVINVAEPAIIADASAFVADRTRPNPDGSLREIHKVSDAGHPVVDFAGSPLSWMNPFMRPGFALRSIKRDGVPIHIQRRTL